MDSTQIAELIVTRISHDIIGNTGAVANAVELLEEDDLEFIDDIKSILKVSSFVLSSRLKFFRIAFGLGNKSLKSMEEVRKFAEDYLATIGNKNYPISFEMNIEAIEEYKFILLGTMIVSDIMIKGGKVRVEKENGTLYIVCESNMAPSSEKISEIVEFVEKDINTSNAQLAPLAYLKELLKVNNYNLSILKSDTYFGLAIK